MSTTATKRGARTMSNPFEPTGIAARAQHLTGQVGNLADSVSQATYGPAADYAELEALEELLGAMTVLQRATKHQRECCEMAQLKHELDNGSSH